MEVTSAPPRRERDWPALVAIAAVWAAAWVAVGAGADVPVIDDWVYAWSVEHLLQTGRLQVPAFSAIYPIAQVAWGALFASVAGFSFVVLRVSTVVLSVVTCGAVYLTIRELGAQRATALLGALALLFHPVYFALSFTFMTEIPFLGLSSVAVYCYVRALGRGEMRMFRVAAAAAVVAFLVRPIGIVLPLAAGAALMARVARRRFHTSDTPLGVSVPKALFALAVPIALMLALQFTLPRIFGPLEWAAIRNENLTYWFSVTFTEYLGWTLTLVSIAVFPLLPLFLPAAVVRSRVLTIAAVALLWAVLCRILLGQVSMPLPNWQTWSLQEIASRSMIGGEFTASAWSSHLTGTLKGLGAIVVACFAVGCVDAWRRRSGGGDGEAVIAALGVLHVGAIHALWFYNDRYYVVLAPVLAIVGALALDSRPLARRLAAGLIVCWAAIAITGARDMLGFNQACADAVRALEAQGIPPSQIDAGYTQNGWRLYAHPENLAPGETPEDDVPFVTSKAEKPYRISNAPQPGTEVLRIVPLPRSTWQASRQIYVLKMKANGAHAPSGLQ